MTTPVPHPIIRIVFAGATALTLGLSAHAVTIKDGSDMFNHYNAPLGAPTAFEFEIKGDVTGIVPCQALEKVINPWQWMHENDPSHPAVNPTTIVYDPGAGVTRITQSGAALPSAVPVSYPYSYPDGQGNRTYHTGINLGNTNNPSPCQQEVIHAVQADAPFDIAARRWIYDIDPPKQLDAVTLSWNGTITKRTKTVAFMTTYIRTVDPKTHIPRSGFWADTLYDPSRPNSFTISNNSAQPILIDTVGFIPNRPVPQDPECEVNSGCQANVDELGTLNAALFPPPGERGSQFKSVSFPRKVMPPGKKIKLTLR